MFYEYHEKMDNVTEAYKCQLETRENKKANFAEIKADPINDSEIKINCKG